MFLWYCFFKTGRRSTFTGSVVRRERESGISITLVSEREEECLFDIKQMKNTEMKEWE